MLEAGAQLQDALQGCQVNLAVADEAHRVLLGAWRPGGGEGVVVHRVARPSDVRAMLTIHTPGQTGCLFVSLQACVPVEGFGLEGWLVWFCAHAALGWGSWGYTEVQ